ncbi:MAG: hypothetical protein ACREDV_11455, partial [Methylocella sp.]
PMLRILVQCSVPITCPQIACLLDGERPLRPRSERTRALAIACAAADNAALGVFFGELHKPRGHPGEIRFDKRQTAERIAPMRIEIHQLHATLMTMDGELPPLTIER